jgi:NAD(P)-dependent dehydrogenase (short-subunit alcohol dehydrogenase family)
VCAGLLGQGARVFSADISAGISSEAEHVGMDITDEGSVVAGFADIAARTGQIDALVNCAYPRTDDWGAHLDEVAIDSFRTNIDWHLGGYFVCCREVISRMPPAGGSIVNIASIYGLVGPTWSIYEGSDMTMPVAYSAIKSGLLGLTRYLATVWGPRGVRVNAVSPGGVEANQPARFTELYKANTPLGRMAIARDIVGPIVFLISDASSYVTGHNLVVDGGWTAR